jgi:hypothetical protein
LFRRPRINPRFLHRHALVVSSNNSSTVNRRGISRCCAA